MTSKVYQFVMCPIGMRVYKNFHEIFVDIETQFGIDTKYSRPFIIKRPATYEKAKFGAWVLDETSCSANSTTIIIASQKITDEESRRIWENKLAQFDGISEVEVMVIDDDDNDKYFLNFNR